MLLSTRHIFCSEVPCESDHLQCCPDSAPAEGKESQRAPLWRSDRFCRWMKISQPRTTGCSCARARAAPLRTCMWAQSPSSWCCTSTPTWITSSACARAGTAARSGAPGASPRAAAPRWCPTVLPSLTPRGAAAALGWGVPAPGGSLWHVMSCPSVLQCVLGVLGWGTLGEPFTGGSLLP